VTREANNTDERSDEQSFSATGHRVVGELRLDPAARDAWVGPSRVDLTAKEFSLLLCLSDHPGWVFSPEQLVRSVWGYEYVGDTGLISVHIRNLRRKLGDSASAPRFIETVRGVGYRLVRPSGHHAGDASRATTSQPLGRQVPFVSREHEKQILAEALESAARGAGSVTLVSGEAGMGKTRLLEELRREAGNRGAIVLQARCHEVGRMTPYWPWVQLLRPLTALFPDEDLLQFLRLGDPGLLHLLPELRLRFAEGILPDS
jgi:DNA-binding winged helix-turn-helix (wHTH) protein